MTPKELFKKAEYYNRKAEYWNKKVLTWFRKDANTEIISHPNGKIINRIKPKK